MSQRGRTQVIHLYKHLKIVITKVVGFPRGSVVKTAPANAGDKGSILGPGNTTGHNY